MAQLFGTTIDCECGRRHVMLPRASFYRDDAAVRLAEACAELTVGRRVVVLADAQTRTAAGEEVAGAFAAAGWSALECRVLDRPGGRWPACDDRTHEKLGGRAPQAELICAVGAGVVSDLGKWLAMDRSLPLVTFATAASMNGYTSANIAPTIGGVKVLIEGRAPNWWPRRTGFWRPLQGR